MGTVIRDNERSWAIEVITQINLMLNGLDLKIKRAGGERTLSVNRKSMFPDVLLYADDNLSRILQGWELKMPDVLITDVVFIKDAERKAKALGLNSFVIWNFTYGKLYVKDKDGIFQETKIWIADHIKSRADVAKERSAWITIIKDIILTVNKFLICGDITTTSLADTLTDNLITTVIERNKDLMAANLQTEASKCMMMECDLKLWWNDFREEYDKDENNMYAAYGKNILLNWTNRILFANIIKKYHNYAYCIQHIDYKSNPTEGNEIIDKIVEQGDFYNILKKLEYNNFMPEESWIDIIDFNQFLLNNHIEKIDQRILQDILEKTVSVSKREIRGQYATPYELADLLCQMTVSDWNCECADLCAGTGTIAKAIVDNKIERLKNPGVSFATTWVSDKYAYPLQIANLAITSVEALNIPINMFQDNVFNLMPGSKIIIKSPIDGSDLEKTIPLFGAIISNLPFVAYNKIAKDENEYMHTYSQQIMEHTGILFTSGKTDLYNYIPFKLHELLEENGRLGIILSNSWLGTDIGKKFFDALQYYYHIQTVVISNCKRWFSHAEVVATIIILQKKKIAPPDIKEKINFWLLNKDIKCLDSHQKEVIIGSVILGKEIDYSLISRGSYSIEKINKIMCHGIVLNTFFHKISWIIQLSECLIPVADILEIKRGERRGWNDLFYPAPGNAIETEYICPVLKNPASLKSYIGHTDIEAFCCHRSEEELEQLGHTGALAWIRKFQDIPNGAGKLLPVVLKKPGNFWYEMDNSAKADFVTALNSDKRLFVSKFKESTFVDQRFTRMLQKRNDISLDFIHALLNSLYGIFAIEAIGFGRGLGVLDASSTKLKKMFMINPHLISKKDETEIIRLFQVIKNRNVKDTEEELKDKDREQFDRKVLQAIGHEELYEHIRNSLLSMQDTRHAARQN